jgi:alpha-N-acetylglucosamine transferase
MVLLTPLSRLTPRSRLAIWISLSTLAALLFFAYAPLPNHVDNYRVATLNAVPYSSYYFSKQEWRPTQLKDTRAKYAFATFLGGHDNDKSMEDDQYFINARILTYQFVHSPKTRSTRSIPFLVIVTKRTSSAKIERLQRDGAIVVVVEDLFAPWITDAPGGNPRYRDVMTKLRLWEFTQFERICLFDSDTILLDSMDGVFDDPAVKTQTTLPRFTAIKPDEAPLPETYAFAAGVEPSKCTLFAYPPLTNESVLDGEHSFPPTEFLLGRDYLNAGFMVFAPSKTLFTYYSSLLNISDKRWNENLPEQNLLNWAHRREEGKTGNMPWKTIDPIWNMHYPTVKDVASGVKSLHDKYWAPSHGDLKGVLMMVMGEWKRWVEEGERAGL